METDGRRSESTARRSRAVTRRDRTRLRALLEVRGIVGGHRVPHRQVPLRAADGTRLTASYLPGPSLEAAGVVVAHGFAAHRRKPAYALLADTLSRHLNVLSLDLRGHGASGGTCTFGDREAFDVSAGIDWLRGAGHDRIAVLGVSMGATSVAHAVASGAVVDAAVLVSAPARVGQVASPAMRFLDDVWRKPWKRRGFELVVGISMISPARWRGVEHPRDLVGRIDRPLLVVHGDDDHFFAASDADEIAAGAGGPVTVWREPPGFGHAEDGLTEAFSDAVGAAVLEALATGRFPARAEVRR